MIHHRLIALCLFAALVLSACAAPAPTSPAMPADSMQESMGEEMEEDATDEDVVSGEEIDDSMAEESMPEEEMMDESEMDEDEMDEDEMDEDEMMEESTGEDGMGESTDDAMGDGMMGDETLESTTFRVRIENVSGDATISTPFSPGVWVLSSEPAQIFRAGEPDRGQGLETQAEDGDPTTLAESLAAAEVTHGIFNMPGGTDMAGAAVPGDAFEFDVVATPDVPYLSITSMFGQSNDLFIAPDENGIALFDMDGNPIAGDVTDQIHLWDAGTEQNEEPGVGPNQAPRQSGPNTGPADEDNTVRIVNDMYSYPAVTDLVRITIEPVEAME